MQKKTTVMPTIFTIETSTTKEPTTAAPTTTTVFTTTSKKGESEK